MLSIETPRLVPPVWQHDVGDEPARLVVRGELDMLTAPGLEDALALVERWGDPIVVDLCDLSFMDASGLHALENASKRARDRGRPFTVIRCPSSVRRLFKLTGMLDMLGEDVPERLEAHPSG